MVCVKGRFLSFLWVFCIVNNLWGGGVHAVSGVYKYVYRHTAGFHVALRFVVRFLLQPGLFSAVFEAGLSFL